MTWTYEKVICICVKSPLKHSAVSLFLFFIYGENSEETVADSLLVLAVKIFVPVFLELEKVDRWFALDGKESKIQFKQKKANSLKQ